MQVLIKNVCHNVVNVNQAEWYRWAGWIAVN
jgi:hypothetical protein